jgi:hypothetical protein
MTLKPLLARLFPRYVTSRAGSPHGWDQKCIGEEEETALNQNTRFMWRRKKAESKEKGKTERKMSYKRPWTIGSRPSRPIPPKHESWNSEADILVYYRSSLSGGASTKGSITPDVEAAMEAAMEAATRTRDRDRSPPRSQFLDPRPPPPPPVHARQHRSGESLDQFDLEIRAPLRSPPAR